MTSTSGGWGGLIPLWILGAPFLLAIFSLMTTPRGNRMERRPPATSTN